MDKASNIAIEEVCKRCHLYTKHCGMLEYPSQCVHSGHFIDGYRKAEEDLTPLINRLCEAILFEWKDAADLARKTLTQIKAQEE